MKVFDVSKLSEEQILQFICSKKVAVILDKPAQKSYQIIAFDSYKVYYCYDQVQDEIWIYMPGYPTFDLSPTDITGIPGRLLSDAEMNYSSSCYPGTPNVIRIPTEQEFVPNKDRLTKYKPVRTKLATQIKEIREAKAFQQRCYQQAMQ